MLLAVFCTMAKMETKSAAHLISMFFLFGFTKYPEIKKANLLAEISLA